MWGLLADFLEGLALMGRGGFFWKLLGLLLLVAAAVA